MRRSNDDLRRRANTTVLVLQDMLQGELTDQVFGGAGGNSQTWERSSEVERALTTRQKDAWHTLGPSPEGLAPETALGRLFGERAARGEVLPHNSKVKASPVRGELYPMNVDNTNLPSEGTNPLPAAALSGTVRVAFEDPERYMLRPEWESIYRTSTIVPFNDESLRSLRVRLRLAARMWKGGMLGVTDECRGTAAFFTVVKKINEKGQVELRLILDMRRVNEAFRRPPWTPLSGPGAMAGMNLSDAHASGWTLEGACGDISNFFYWLGLTPFLSTFFIFEGISPAQLREHLVGSGWKKNLPDPRKKHVCVIVCPMGWSWAVWTAQHCLKDTVLGPTGLLIDPEGDPEDSTTVGVERLLVQGSPTPEMGLTGATRAVIVLYVDDFGVLVLENGKLRYMKGIAKRLRDVASARLREAGFTVHKETDGSPTLLVGIVLGGPRSDARPRSERLWEGILATEEVIRRGEVPVDWVASLAGYWCWNMLLFRPALAVLDELYRCIRSAEPGMMIVLSPRVKRELQACWAVAPLLVANLAAPFLPIMYMMDASPTGGGLVQTDATTQELQEEARYGERSGWVVVTDTDILLQTAGASDAGMDEVNEMQQESPDLSYRILMMGGGERREDDLADQLMQLATRINVHAEVVHLDPLGYPRTKIHDLSVVEEIAGRVSGRDFDAVIATVSPPFGRPQMEEPAVLGSLIVADASIKINVPSLIIHRCPAVDELPEAWKTPAARGLEEKMICHIADGCMVEEDPPRVTRILSSPVGFEQTLAVPCGHTPRCSLACSGVATGEPEFRPSTKLARLLASRIMGALLNQEELGRRDDDVKEGPSDERVYARQLLSGTPGERVRAPPIQAHWSQLSRWRETYRLLWARVEPSNILETTMAFSAIKHITRVQSSWDKRVVLVTDNLCCLAVLSKGRSSSRRLGMLCRIAAALLLATGVRMILRWCRSRVNHADGPSRQRPIGYAG